MRAWQLASVLALFRLSWCQHSEYFLGQFLSLYLNASAPLRVLEVGSRRVSVNGPGLRALSSPHWQWVGIDIVEGPCVDIVLKDPYEFPFRDGEFDVVISSDAFEHVDLFWLTFLEMCRVSRAYIYLTAPSYGEYHGFPGDSWRFLADSPKSLQLWAHRSGYNMTIAFTKIMTHLIWWTIGRWKPMIAVFAHDTVKGPFPEILSDFSPEYVRDNAAPCWGRSSTGLLITQCCLTGSLNECFQREDVAAQGWNFNICCHPGPGMMRQPFGSKRSLPLSVLLQSFNSAQPEN